MKRAKPRGRKRRGFALFILLISLAFGFYYISTLDFSFLTERINNDPRYLKLFSIAEVNIKGNKHLNKEEVINLTGISDYQVVTEIPLAQIQENLMKNSWVKYADIKRILPNIIEIKIKEREPKAVLWHDQQFHLIDEEGYIIEPISDDQIEERANFIIILGTNAEHSYYQVIDVLFHKGIQHKVLSLAFVSERRWDIYLKSGVLVKLPEENIDKALDILKEMLKEDNEKSVYSTIDLRLIPDKIFFKVKKYNKVSENGKTKE
jgi:cell division septal protein FtsQ